MSLWIESHQSLLNHRKTLRVCAALNVDKVRLIGHLHMLWWWGLDNANEQGYLGDITAVEIAAAAGWSVDDADDFVEALLSAGRPHGFMERKRGQYVLHDWRQYAGKYTAKKAANASRMKAARAGSVQRTSRARAGAIGEERGGEDRTGEESRGEEITAPPASPRRPASPASGDSNWDFALSLYRTNLGEIDQRTRDELRALYDAVPDPAWVNAAINQAATADRPGFGYVKRTLEDCIRTSTPPSTIGGRRRTATATR